MVIHRQNNAMWCFFAKSRIFGNMRNKAPSSECSRSRSKHLRNTTYATKNYVFFFVRWIAKIYWSSLGSYGCCFNLVFFFFFSLFFLMMYVCMYVCMYVSMYECMYAFDLLLKVYSFYLPFVRMHDWKLLYNSWFLFELETLQQK